MGRKLIFLLLIASFGFASYGQGKSRAKKRTPPRPYTQLRTGIVMWQEAIDLKKDASSAKMESQLIGPLFAYSYVRPVGKRNRWLQVYSAELGLGTLKGKGNSDSIPDELKNQPWYMVGVSPALIYRTTSVSEVGVVLPLYYRMIGWKLDPSLGLDPDRDTSFSAGLGGVYTNRLTKTSHLHVALVRQHMWNSTQWMISWQMDIK